MHDEVLKRSLSNILQHIEVCKNRFSKIKTPEDFVNSEYGVELLDAIVARLQAVGEIIKNISQKHPDFFKENNEDIEWNKIVRFRDFISHHYDRLDYEVVFEIGSTYLPKLDKAIQVLFDSIR
jgi:uncharacterized protein with HEPN domain